MALHGHGSSHGKKPKGLSDPDSRIATNPSRSVRNKPKFEVPTRMKRRGSSAMKKFGR